MKHGRSLSFLLLSTTIGCGPEPHAAPSDVGAASLTAVEDTAVPATPPDLLPPENTVPLRTLTFADTADVDADGADEVVELWVAADRDDRGRLMMDDGQRWLLAVRDGDNLQPLFAEFVQLAAPRVWVYDPGAGGTPIIVLELAQQAGFGVETYRYDPARAGYVRERHIEFTGNLLGAGPMDVDLW